MAISIRPTSISSLFSTIPFRGRQIHRFQIGGWDPATRSKAFSRHQPIKSSSTSDLQRSKSQLEALFCYDKSIPEEIIEKPIGLSLNYKEIGNNPPCIDCQAKGAVLCATCSGSGLYVESILESQGVIVKVRCLGCGGTGNIMCSECGGRGHI